jgi:phosphatidylglycerol:prolipoprotein diacylglycerol transferase
MFSQNIDPNLITLGPLNIRFYGIVYALGFLLITYLLIKEAKKNKIKNLTSERAQDITIYAMLFGLIGARLFHVASDFYLYQNNLLEIFAFWKGGLGWYGGLIGGVAAIIIYCRKHKIDIWHVLDNMSVPLPLVIGFARIANYINSEHLGFPSNLPWCVVFQKIDTVCRHPVQLYESLSMFILFFALIIISLKLRQKKGTVFWSFIGLYGIARFITDYFRQVQSFYLFGLAHTQIISLVMIFISIYFVFKSSKQKAVKK